MNSIKGLIGYEYKKMFLRKSTWIVLAVAIGITLLSCYADTWGNVYVEGEPVSTHYEEMMIDRSYARALAGREVDEILIKEMQEAYSRVPDVPLYAATKEYQTYARPYSAIYYLVRSVSKDVEHMEGNQYYQLRNAKVFEQLKEVNLTDVEVERHLERNERVKTPFVFQHVNGYERIITGIYSLGVTITFLIAICIAPLFANEYSDRTDQLILTTRYGKNRAIVAKLITGISFSLISAVILLLIQCLPALLLHGFNGWDAPIQLVLITSTNPITLLEGVLILCCMVIISAILISCFCMFLSSKLKSSFGVIVIVSTSTIACMMINVSDQYRSLLQLMYTLPANVMSGTSIFTSYFYIIFQQCFTTYQAVPVIYGVLSALLIIYGYKSFKYHQIS